jgi:hypothetical protein
MDHAFGAARTLRCSHLNTDRKANDGDSAALEAACVEAMAGAKKSESTDSGTTATRTGETPPRMKTSAWKYVGTQICTDMLFTKPVLDYQWVPSVAPHRLSQNKLPNHPGERLILS